MPFENDLGVRVTRKHKDGVTVECPIRPALLNTDGMLHGGVAAAIVDEAAWHAIQHHFQCERSCTTTELKINYLLPIRGSKVIGRVVLLRAGKTLCVSRVDLFDERKRLAGVALVTYMLLAPRTGS